MAEGQESQSLLKPTLESNPLQDGSMQDFIKDWAGLNSGMKVNFVTRDSWRKEAPLQKNEEGQTLSMPEDMNLLEMISVIRRIDQDTFKDKPDKWEEKQNQYKRYGYMFEDIGVYLAQNVDSIKEGKDIAIATARDYYRVGKSYATGEEQPEPTLEEMLRGELPDSAEETFDRWFGVNKLAEFKNRDPQDPSVREQTRHEMFGQFFKTAEKAAESSRHKKAIEGARRRHIEEPFKRPTKEMIDALFDRGLEKLASEFGKNGDWEGQVVENFKELGIDLNGEKKSLREHLEIPRLKDELTEIRKSGDTEKISKKEKEIALHVQNAMSSLSYKGYAGTPNNPQDIVESNYINCVGASLLGGAMLNETGIHYLVTNEAGSDTTSGHSTTLLITTDKRVYHQDFLNPSQNFEYDNEGIRKTVEKYMKSSMRESLIIPLSGEIPFIQVRHAKEGHKSQVLQNTSLVLEKEGKYDQALMILNYLSEEDSNNMVSLFSKGTLQYEMGDNDGVVDSLSRYIKYDPDEKFANLVLGEVLSEQERFDEALPYLEKTKQLMPDYPQTYLQLGRIYADKGKSSEAIESFQEFIRLSDTEEIDESELNIAKQYVDILSNS